MAKKHPHGNGARKVLLAYFNKSLEPRFCNVDHLLAHLWVEGFVVKPLGPEELKPRKSK